MGSERAQGDDRAAVATCRDLKKQVLPIVTERIRPRGFGLQPRPLPKGPALRQEAAAMPRPDRIVPEDCTLCRGSPQSRAAAQEVRGLAAYEKAVRKAGRYPQGVVILPRK